MNRFDKIRTYNLAVEPVFEDGKMVYLGRGSRNKKIRLDREKKKVTYPGFGSFQIQVGDPVNVEGISTYQSAVLRPTSDGARRLYKGNGSVEKSERNRKMRKQISALVRHVYGLDYAHFEELHLSNF